MNELTNPQARSSSHSCCLSDRTTSKLQQLNRPISTSVCVCCIFPDQTPNTLRIINLKKIYSEAEPVLHAHVLDPSSQLMDSRPLRPCVVMELGAVKEARDGEVRVRRVGGTPHLHLDPRRKRRRGGTSRRHAGTSKDDDVPAFRGRRAPRACSTTLQRNLVV
jgi:hypothetical protein